MTVGEIISIIELFAAPELQEDYDNARLITGSKKMECTGALCCLDATMEVLEEAKSKNSNLVIAHHPILFKGIKSLIGSNYIEQVLIYAIKNDIAIYAVHTNLDNVILGVNGKIAEKLGLTNIRTLAPKSKMLRRLITFAPKKEAEKVRAAVFAAGAGHIGKYSECSFNSDGVGTFKAGEGADPYVGEIGKQHQEEETKIEIVYPFYLERQVVNALVDNHPYEEVAYDIFTMENVHYGIGSGIIGEHKDSWEEKKFLQFVKDTFKVGAVKHTTLRGKPIRKVAVCGGSGSFLLKNAISEGADVYISSDFKYHEFFDAQGKIIIADIGHYESEQYTIELIYDLLKEKTHNFAVLKTGVNTNPVHYLV